LDEKFSFLLITVMSSYSDSEPPADDSIRGRIIRQQADKLARMSALGDLAQEQREEDRRGRDEDARRVIEAEEVARAARVRAARKAAKKAKRKARERDSEESPPRKKKARVHANGAGASAVPTVEPDEGMEFPEVPCNRCVSRLAY
jgi:hypothetical protein